MFAITAAACNAIPAFQLRAVTLTVAAAALLAAACPPDARALGFKDAPGTPFDKAAYETRLRKAFDGDQMGYATVLIKNGQVVSQIAGGLARNAADGSMPMTVSTPANIGSTIKFTGGIALLQLFESKDPAINPKGLTVDQWLATPIWAWLPDAWQKVADDSIRTMTFGQLLRHQSGFRALAKEDLGADGYKRMVDYLVKGVEPGNVNDRDYENANISLITYLIPMIANPALRAAVNTEASVKKWHPEGLEIHQRIANAWEQHMHTKVYSKLTPAIRPSCNPTAEYPARGMSWAPDYRFKGDTAKGATRDSRNTNGYCQAQGGWYITARELAAFVANFDATQTLVSHSLRDKLFNDDDADKRLVWSFTIADKAIDDKFHYSQLPYMGGDHGGAHASIVALPGGYYAVGIINSDEYNSWYVSARLVRAFKSGFGMPEDPYCAQYPAQLSAATGGYAAALTAYQKAVQGGNLGTIYYAQQQLNAAQTKLTGIREKGAKAVCSQ